MYNGLVRGRNRVKEAYSGIDVQLKRRVEPRAEPRRDRHAATPSTSASTFEEVTRASGPARAGRRPGRRRAGEQHADRRPAPPVRRGRELPAAAGRRRTSASSRAELSDIEEKIAFARQFYNTNVLDYNNRMQTVPTVFIAGMFGFTPGAVLRGGGRGARRTCSVDFGPRGSTPPRGTRADTSGDDTPAPGASELATAADVTMAEVPHERVLIYDRIGANKRSTFFLLVGFIVLHDALLRVGGNRSSSYYCRRQSGGRPRLTIRIAHLRRSSRYRRRRHHVLHLDGDGARGHRRRTR